MTATTTALLVTLTDETIDAASGADLRQLATDAGVTGFDAKTTIFDVTIGPEVASTPGALTAIDKAISALRRAYADRGPEVINRYGNTTEIKVWHEDASLRQSIKWARDRAVKDAAASE